MTLFFFFRINQVNVSLNKYNIELNKTNAMRATGIVATSHQTFCMKISVSKIALCSAFNYRLYTSQA